MHQQRDADADGVAHDHVPRDAERSRRRGEQQRTYRCERTDSKHRVGSTKEARSALRNAEAAEHNDCTDKRREWRRLVLEREGAEVAQPLAESRERRVDARVDEI